MDEAMNLDEQSELLIRLDERTKNMASDITELKDKVFRKKTSIAPPPRFMISPKGWDTIKFIAFILAGTLGIGGGVNAINQHVTTQPAAQNAPAETGE